MGDAIDLVKLLSQAGLWGLVVLFALIITYLIYQVIKKNKNGSELKGKGGVVLNSFLDTKYNELKECISKLASQNSINHKDLMNKMGDVEDLVKDLKLKLKDIGDSQIRSSVEQQSIIKSVDNIMDKFWDLTVDLKTFLSKFSGSR